MSARTSRSGHSHVAEVALRYADHGWPVIPIHTPTDSGCSCVRSRECGSPGKHPRTRHGLDDASIDLDRVREWWTRWPDANVAVATGARSGLLVLDIDLPHGPTSLDELQSQLGALPRTCEQRTGSGGRQLLFAYPPGQIGNRARVLPGIDVRGDGGYIVVPPSRHLSGDAYLWSSRTPLAPPPDWLVGLLTRAREVEAERSPARADLSTPDLRDELANYGASALRDELAELSQAVEGSRNDSLNRAAFKLGQLVGAGALDGDEVRAHLERTGEAIGLDAVEVRRTVASGLTAGIARPRAIAPTPNPARSRGSSSVAPVRQLVRRR